MNGFPELETSLQVLRDEFTTAKDKALMLQKKHAFYTAVAEKNSP